MLGMKDAWLRRKVSLARQAGLAWLGLAGCNFPQSGLLEFFYRNQPQPRDSGRGPEFGLKRFLTPVPE
jgi:hypothetical protein